jgi:hypothetical protein
MTTKTKTIQDIQQPEEQGGANYKLLSVFNKFEILETNDIHLNGTSGNIQRALVKAGESYYTRVSAPMLLARLVSAGCKPMIEGQDGYKTTWAIALKHKRTGTIVTFYDYKGASSFGSSGCESLQFKKDVVKVLNALADPTFPHPYDGCVVGEIA